MLVIFIVFLFVESTANLLKVWCDASACEIFDTLHRKNFSAVFWYFVICDPHTKQKGWPLNRILVRRHWLAGGGAVQNRPSTTAIQP